MEGKFASEGLQAIDGDDDMLTAMARELVENKGIGESAQNVWRSLGQLRPMPLIPFAAELEVAHVEGTEACSPSMLPSDGTLPSTPVLESVAGAPQSPSKPTEAEQLSLF
jgi:hypothetical protein